MTSHSDIEQGCQGKAGDTSTSFPNTSWSVLAEAGKGDRAALEDLLARYWRPVFAYLRRKGHQEADAADLTQAFLTDVVLSRNLLGRAERARGRFRAFMLKALKCFQVDAHRRRQAHGAAQARFVAADSELLGSHEADEDDPVAAYERQWARTVMHLALEELERYLESNGYVSHWTVFKERIVLPATYGTEPTAVARLAERLGVDHDQVAKMQYTVRRRLQSMLRQIVAATVDDVADIDHEVGYLHRYIRP